MTTTKSARHAVRAISRDLSDDEGGWFEGIGDDDLIPKVTDLESLRLTFDTYVNSLKHSGLYSLATEVDRCLKKVQEGVEIFEDMLIKVRKPSMNSNQKDKLETELKREIKKLQRHRDQVKSWMSSGDFKDEDVLVMTKDLIETEMERFKYLEKHMKMKAYSREGLQMSCMITDALTKDKEELNSWLVNTIDALQLQVDKFESELECMFAAKRKRLDKDKQNRAGRLKQFVENHRFHVSKLERLMRMADNLSLDDFLVKKFVTQVKKIRDDVAYYLDSHEDPDFEHNEYLYDDIDGFTEFDEGLVNQQIIALGITATEPPTKDEDVTKEADDEEWSSSTSTIASEDSRVNSPVHCNLANTNVQDCAKVDLDFGTAEPSSFVTTENQIEETIVHHNGSGDYASFASILKKSENPKIIVAEPEKPEIPHEILEETLDHDHNDTDECSPEVSEKSPASTESVNVDSSDSLSGLSTPEENEEEVIATKSDWHPMHSEIVRHTWNSFGAIGDLIHVDEATVRKMTSSQSNTMEGLSIDFKAGDPAAYSDKSATGAGLRPINDELYDEWHKETEDYFTTTVFDTTFYDSEKELSITEQRIQRQYFENLTAILSAQSTRLSQPPRRPRWYERPHTEFKPPASYPTPDSAPPNPDENDMIPSWLCQVPIGPMPYTPPQMKQLYQLNAAFLKLPENQKSPSKPLYCRQPQNLDPFVPENNLMLKKLFTDFYYDDTVVRRTTTRTLMDNGWRHHNVLRIWMLRDGIPEFSDSTHEQGNYFYFDYKVWDFRRMDNFVFEFQHLLEPKD